MTCALNYVKAFNAPKTHKAKFKLQNKGWHIYRGWLSTVNFSEPYNINLAHAVQIRLVSTNKHGKSEV